MPWVEVFAVFFVCHNVGDYLLQTEFEATNKFGGLGADRTARRALLGHIATYTLAFVPGLIWLSTEAGPSAAAATAIAIAIPHLIQDDGRLLDHYLRHAKRVSAVATPAVRAVTDQAFHLTTLFITAVAIGS